MRKVQRWRYYCDHCKKSGGHAGHMVRHERGCTANPNRQCGVCDRIGINAAPLTELLTLVREIGKPEHNEFTDHDWVSIDADAFKKLREAADGCPCCILAALRQTHASVGNDIFDFKKEIKDVWKEYDDNAYQDRVASYHAY